MKDQLIEQLNDADLVLVGIGEDFEEADYLKEVTAYQEVCDRVARDGAQWVMPYVNRYFLKNNVKLQKAFKELENLLEGKNYFVVSVCMNGFLSEINLKKDRVTEPCGGYMKLQCKDACTPVTEVTGLDVFEEIEKCIIGEMEFKDIHMPVCAACGSPMELNSLYAQNYAEAGYTDSWSVYMKWLQGTLNKKLCVLELGAGMMFSGVTRFRFEKIVALNQKARLIRVHQHLYQLPEEIAERGLSIAQNAVAFLAE